MKQNILHLFVTALFSIVFLSACSGAASIASSWPGLLVEGDTAYVAYNQHVYAVDIADGKEIWRFPAEAIKNETFFSPPVLTTDGQLLVGSYNNVLYSINSQTGRENWSFKDAKDRYVASPLATEKGIFAPIASKILFVLDNQGNLQWSINTGGVYWAQPTTDPEGSTIFLPSMDHFLYAINTLNQSVEWKTEDLNGSIVGTPAISPAGVLYMGTFASELVAINRHNGNLLWRVPTKGWVWSGPVFNDNRLYFGDLGGNFYSLDSTSGTVIWKIQPDGTIIGSPLVTQDTIYFGTEAGTLYAIDYDGKTVWTKSIGGKIYTTPKTSGDLILVSPFQIDELLVALDKNGTQKWAFIPEKKK